MSGIEGFWAWCRHKVGWSNFGQSWQELHLFGITALIASTLSIALWGWLLPAQMQVVLWIVLAFTGAILLRRGWLQFFGPVLYYDMLCQARRSRFFLLRIIYAALMISLLFISFLEVDRERLPQQKRYVRMAESYFIKFMAVQFVAVSLLTPAYVAGAISDEKGRRTLEFMLATDLHNREIVLSKLMSRMANLTLLILTGLPILSFLQFLGGIDPNLLLAGFLATFMTMVSLASFSIFTSVESKNSQLSILGSYLAPLVYVLFGCFVFLRVPFATRTLGWGNYVLTPTDFNEVFNAGNLPVVLYEIVHAIDQGRIESVLGPILRRYVIFHLVMTLIWTMLAMWRLRVVALQHANETQQTARIRQRRRPEVWNSFLLWKEVFIDDQVHSSWRIRWGMGILFLLSVGTIMWRMFEQFRSGDGDVRDWVALLGTLIACLAILVAAVRAAMCIASERDKNTFDFLLTTPLDSDAILKAKL